MEAVAESAAHVVESAAHVPKSASTHVAAVGMDYTRSSGNPEAAATADDEGGERTTTGSPEVAAGGLSMDEVRPYTTAVNAINCGGHRFGSARGSRLLCPRAPRRRHYSSRVRVRVV